MAEIAGLVLGGIPIVMESFQKLVVFTQACESFERQLPRARTSVFTQLRKFSNSVRLLLKDAIDEDTLETLLGPEAPDLQRTWRECTELKIAFEKTISRNPTAGKALQAAIDDIIRLFEELVKQLQKISEESKLDPERPASWLIKSFTLWKRKIEWHAISHPRAEKLLGHIFEQNQNIEQLARDVRQCVRRRLPDLVHLSDLDEIEMSQKVFGTLYGAFATSWTICGCRHHAVSLSLDLDHVTETTGTSCVARIKPSQPIKSIMVKGKFGWHLDILLNLEGSHSGSEATQSPPEDKASLLGRSVRPASSICAVLSRRTPTGNSGPKKVLTQLQLDRKNRFQVTDPGCDGHSSSLQQSLQTVLGGSNRGSASGSPPELKQSLGETRRRLQLSYSLALHLVRLYSTGWLTGDADRVWTSRDIVFFPSHTERRWRDASPYLFAPARAGSCGRQLARMPRVKHPHVFALGVILLEVVLCEQMDMDPSLSGDEFFHAVLNLAMGNAVEAEMGARYADLVRRCILFNCESEKVEFGEREAQKSFLNNILGPFHECLHAVEHKTGFVVGTE